MFTRPTALTPVELRAAIVQEPLVVPPETTVMEAIAQMSGLRSLCHTTQTADSQMDALHLEARSSCVIVVEAGQVIGILTERDVVRLMAQRHTLDSLIVQEVMARPVVTLAESNFTDLFSAINLLQHHRIRHLPILDEQGCLVGLVTHESLRKISRPLDLLRCRIVQEVMTSQVIYASSDGSVLAMAQHMAQHRVSSVVIVEPGSATESLPMPVGMLTERDLVQFQALGLNLETCRAETVMSTPIFTVKPEESLWGVQQLMEQHFIHRVAVTGTQGELLGIVTQTSLLQALNPLELYQLAEILEAKVERLEAEKVALLENRAVELEREVELRTAALQTKAEREKLVAQIANRIRISLNLQEILDVCVAEVRTFLDCDRVLVYQFQPDWSGIVIAESVNHGWLSALGSQINDSCFQQQTTNLHDSDHPIVVNNIHTTGYSKCHLQLLERYQVKANLVVPIRVSEQLWGLLITHQCADYREWQREDISLLQDISVQLAIALQQATTHQQLQEELRERRQTETRLLESEQHYVNLTAAVPVGIFRTDARGNFIYVNQQWCQITGITSETASREQWLQGLHPDDYDRVVHAWEQSLQENCPSQLEYRFQHADGTLKWIYGQSVPERDAHGQAIGHVGSITDISECKEAEELLRQSEQRFRHVIANAPFPIMIHAENGEVLEINAAWTELTGYTHQDIPTIQAWAQRAYGDRAASVLENIITKKYALKSRWEEGEFTVTTNDGSQRIWDFSSAPLGSLPDGRRSVISMAADVTQRRQVEIALRESEARLRDITTSVPGAIIRYILYADGSDRVSYMSPGCFDLWELETRVAEQNPQILWDAIHPDDLPGMQASVMESAQTLSPWSWEWRITTYLSNRQKWVRGAGKPERLANGDVVWTTVILDISDRKLAEAALRESEARWQFALEGSGDGVWDWNSQTDQVFFSRQWKAMLGYAEDELGDSLEEWDSRIHPDDKAQCYTDLNKHLSGETPTYQNEHRIRCKDDSYKWILARGKVIEWASDGQPLRVIGTHTDISERKLAEMQLQNLIAGTAATTGKDFFPALVKHITEALNVSYAIVNEQRDNILHTLAFCADGILQPTSSFELTNTPCQRTLEEGIFYCESLLQQKFSEDLILAEMEAESYLGIALYDRKGNTIGDLCILDKKPLQNPQRAEEMLRVFGARAAAELERQRASTLLEQLNQELEAKVEERTAALKERETRYRALMKGASDGILLADEQGNLLEANHKLEKLLGYTRAELTSMHFTQLQPPEELSRVITTFEELANQQLSQILDVNFLHQDGRIVPCDVSASAIEINGEKIIQSIFRDITERKQAEIALQTKTEELDRFFSLALDLLCIANTDGFFLRLNNQWEKTLGYLPSELEGKKFMDYVHPDDIEKTLDAMIQLQAGKKILNFVNRYRCRDGFYRWIEWRAAPSGHLIYAAARDITERKRTDEQIRRYTAQLEASNQELEAFAYSVSHDLRAPLRAIDGFSKALLEDYREIIDEEGQDYFARIRNNVSRMGMLIDDLLRLSRVSRSEIRYTKVNLSTLAQELIDELLASEPERQVEFVSVPEAIAWADPTLMRVVLSNLLANAWKFTSHHQRARIEFGVVNQEEHPTYFVRDDGAGFDMNYAKMLFGVFQRLHSTNEFPGTGIGLATVQRAIHRHGGKVWAEAVIEQGATFYFTFPYTPLDLRL